MSERECPHVAWQMVDYTTGSFDRLPIAVRLGCGHCPEVRSFTLATAGTGERCPTCGSDDPLDKKAMPRMASASSPHWLCADPWHAGPATEETT